MERLVGLASGGASFPPATTGGHDSKTTHETLACPEAEFFIDQLLVRIHLIIEMDLVDRPCAMGVAQVQELYSVCGNCWPLFKFPNPQNLNRFRVVRQNKVLEFTSNVWALKGKAR